MKLFFKVGHQRPQDQAISSFRLALNDSTFALNSLLRIRLFVIYQGYAGMFSQLYKLYCVPNRLGAKSQGQWK